VEIILVFFTICFPLSRQVTLIADSIGLAFKQKKSGEKPSGPSIPARDICFAKQEEPPYM
jgi:hypothetical protein